jgi:hypothetical protein
MSRQQAGEPGHPASSQENTTTNLDSSALIDIELAPAPAYHRVLWHERRLDLGFFEKSGY